MLSLKDPFEEDFVGRWRFVQAWASPPRLEPVMGYLRGVYWAAKADGVAKPPGMGIETGVVNPVWSLRGGNG